MSFIYKITNLNNLKYYYGKTSRTIEERFEEHKKCALKRSYVNSHLYRAMNKEGFESFTIELVEECSDDVVDERERYWIELTDACNPAVGYNISEGGTGGDTLKHLSAEELKRRSTLLSINNTGKSWYNNGVEEHRFDADEVPTGYFPGRLEISVQKLKEQSTWFNRVSDEVKTSYLQSLSEGHKKQWSSKSEEERQAFKERCSEKAKQQWNTMSEETLIRRSAKLSAARKGKLLYNNGTEQHFFKPDEVPEGYIPGKLKKKPLDDPEDI